ncbi:YDG domain-containing protein, partial [Derxia gummosa]|uniref:YDG domain-containing protein n=1 Tax=Derxia gummosa DSM 723 TaxID=1121388 RepID=A0A9B0ABV5_9BURK
MHNGPGSMNRIYRLIWNELTGSFVAVAEFARARGKRSRGIAGAVLAAGGVALAAPVSAQAPPDAGRLAAAVAARNLAGNALPTGGNVVAGSATIGQNGARMDINQSSQRAAINWLGFDIGGQAQVNFNQPNANSATLNRVTGADPSAILGRLTSNGQVLLVNPNGIVFGQGSQVNVGGIVASTLDLADADFMAGKLNFTRGAGAGAVLNRGAITTAAGGYAALLAPEAINEGVISARLGTVALAAGDAVTLDVNGASLVGVRVDPATVKALVENRQMIVAEGGRVVMSAGAAQRLLQGAVAGGADGALVDDGGRVRIVSNTGTVSAAGGAVKVEGGNIDLAGNIDVGGASAGTVAIGGDYLSQSGRVEANATGGKGGGIAIQADTVVQTASAHLGADGSTGGGSIRVEGAAAGATGTTAPGMVYSSATMSARGLGDGAKGGDIAITASDVELRAAAINAAGDGGGGRVRIGGGFHGLDSGIANAVNVGVNASTVITADAGTHGDGGEVVVWSDGKTVFAGLAYARGGTQSGNGGKAEFSGAQTLIFQGDAQLNSRAGGAKGQLLLDPRNITVDEINSALATLAMSDPTPGNTSGFGTVTRVLSNGNVVVTAPYADTGATADTGAVYMFDSRSGALLSNLRGTNANDHIGSAGIQTLANGNYLVLSPDFETVGSRSYYFIKNYDAGQQTGASSYDYTSSYPRLTGNVSSGAITWQSGSTGGGSSLVSSGNSLTGNSASYDVVGGTNVYANDRLGQITQVSVTGYANAIAVPRTTTIVELSNGNVAIATPTWFNGRGAVTWLNGSNGQLADGSAGGRVSSTVSLVGSTAIRSTAPIEGDGSGHNVYVLDWNSALSTTLIGSTGSAVRTTTPAAPGDFVGEDLVALGNGSYVVGSRHFTNGSATYAGAVTWGSGSGGTVGAVSSSNSLVGGSKYDFVGSGGIRAVGSTQQNYLVLSPEWSATGNAAAGRYVNNAPNGAVTWVDGSNGQSYGSGSAGALVSSSNSLIGNAGDGVGALSNSVGSYTYSANSQTSTYLYVSHTAHSTSADGLRVLANGNWLAVDTSWNSSAGAVTFGLGASGLAGVVSSSNSLVGSTASDGIGNSVLLLDNSNWVTWSSVWDNGAATNAGAVTWGSGTTGRTGAVSASNSLVGSDAYETVGSNGVLAVGAAGSGGLRANYLVISPFWGNRSGQQYSTVNYGAITWGNGSTGTSGAVSSSNSLTGSNAGDYLGSYHYSDSRGSDNYFYSASWNGAVNPYAWTANVTTTVDVLDNGNYIVRSPSWNGGRGAVTWGSGAAGITGNVSSANSLVGSTADAYTTVTTSDGSKTFTDNSTGSTVSATFSRVTTYQTMTGDHVGLLGQALSGGRYMAVSPTWGDGKGALSMIGASGTTGTVGSGNSVLGSTADVYTDANRTALVSTGDRLGTLPDLLMLPTQYTSTATSGGKTYVENGSTTRRLGPLWLNHTANSTSETSYRGSTGFTYNAVSNWYVTGFTLNYYPIIKELSNGAVLVASPGWNNGSNIYAGAITWFSSAGQLADGSSGGTLGTGNSLVGSHARDWLGYRLPVDGVVELQGPNAGGFVLVNPQWWDDRGAVTWGSASAGVVGTVGSGNSLVGTRGATRPATTLVPRVSYNGETGTWYSSWAVRDNTTGQVAGAVTRDGDRVGAGGVFALADGNAVVSSPFWDFNATGLSQGVYLGWGAPNSRGAATWLNGGTGNYYGGGAGGAISSSNSLVGSNYGDAVSWAAWEQNSPGLTTTFVMPGITELTGGRYVVASPYWANGTATAAGAVTFSDAGGIAGAVSTANSLVGSTTGDHIGLGNGIRVGTTGTNRQMVSGVTVVQAWNPDTSSYDTNYFVRSADWTNTADGASGGARAGAVTWVNGTTGIAAGETTRGAVVGAGNSLVGSTANDAFGTLLTTLSGTVNGQSVRTGDLLIFSNLADCDVAGAGAVTLVSGLTGATGPASWRNSVVGLAPVANGQSTQSITTGTNTLNYTSDIQYALLPTAVTASESVQYRPLIWAAPNATSGKNSSVLYALTVVDDSLATQRNAGLLNGDAGGDLNWNSPLFAGNASGFTGVGGSNGLLGFSASTGSDVVITPGTLTAMLDAGTDVTLQASRDITVVRDITVSAGGNGGDLALDAGRSIRIYGDIDTDNGNFTATANRSLADGVVAADCPDCASRISMARGSTIDAGSGTLTLRILDSDKTSDVAGAITVANLRGNDIRVLNEGLDGSGRGMGIRFTAGASVGDTSTSNVLLRAGGSSSAGTGGIVLGSDTVITGSSSATLEASAAQAGSAFYLGSAGGSGAALSLTAAQAQAIVKQSSGFANVNFGRADQTGNLNLGALDMTQAAALRSGAALGADLRIQSGSGGITLSGNLVTNNDASHATTLATAGGGTIALGSSNVTNSGSGWLELETRGSGTVTQSTGAVSTASLLLDTTGSTSLTGSGNRFNTVAGSLGGGTLVAGTGNVTVGTVGGASGLASSAAFTLRTTGANTDLTLNNAVSATTGDITLAAARNFTNNVAGNAGIVASAGRYLVYSANPTDTTEGMTGYVKHYNQTYSASAPGYAGSGNWFLYSVAPTLTIGVGAGGNVVYGSSGSVPGITSSGFIDGDSFATATTGSLASTTSSYTPSGAGFIPVGTYTVNLTGQGTLASSLGYTITVNTGSSSFTVTPKPIDVAGLTANSRVYDGTTTASVSGTASLTGGGATSGDGHYMAGDTVNISGTATGSFTDRNAGTGKSVQLAGLTLGGADAGNYSISLGSVTADITPKPINITGLTAASSRVYDGTTAATVGGSASYDTEAVGSGTTTDGRAYTLDSISLSGTATGTYNSSHVAGANTVTFGGLTLGGTNAGNYTLVMGSQAATITAKPLNITGVTADGKTYDGTATATFTGTAALGTGGSAAGDGLLVGSDAVSLTGTLAGSFTNFNAGTRSVTTSGLSLTGTNAGDYTLSTWTPTATILARSISVAFNSQVKTYGDSDPTLTFTVGGLGLVGSDSIASVFTGAGSTATGASATAGTHAITVGTLAVGNSNYTLGSVTNGTLTVNKAALTVTANDGRKTYGDADPTLGYTVDASQLRYTDTASVVSGVQLSTATGSAAT